MWHILAMTWVCIPKGPLPRGLDGGATLKGWRKGWCGPCASVAEPGWTESRQGDDSAVDAVPKRACKASPAG